MKANKKEGMIVERYLGAVQKELYGIDINTKTSVIDELKVHIDEKSKDLANQRGLEKPDEETFKEVVESLGTPKDVVAEYIKVLPKKLGLDLKLFITIQGVIGILAIIIGIDELFYAFEIPRFMGYNMLFMAGIGLIGVFWLVFGCAMIILLTIQIRTPQRIVDYGTFTAVVSLAIILVIIILMLRFTLIRILGLDITESDYYMVFSPLIVFLVFVFIVGLERTYRFQRLLEMEEVDELIQRKRSKRKRNILVSSFIVAMLLAATSSAMYGYSSTHPIRSDVLVSTEDIGGQYNARIEHWSNYVGNQWYDNYKIVYYIDGEELDGSFMPELRPSLDWIKDNTPENATILSWWDYGHMIRGYANRESVVDYPSESMLDTVADVTLWGKPWEKPLCPEETIKDVGIAFTADDFNITKQIMEKYNASYILTVNRDVQGIAYVFFRAAEKDPLDYFDYQSGLPTEDGEKTFLFRVWSSVQIQGFELSYSDVVTRLYVPI